jgi:hypothetical protein
MASKASRSRPGRNSGTREIRIIAAVGCPVCRVSIGEACRLRDDERAQIARNPKYFVHRDRRVAWQMVRDGEVT